MSIFYCYISIYLYVHECAYVSLGKGGTAHEGHRTPVEGRGQLVGIYYLLSIQNSKPPWDTQCLKTINYSNEKISQAWQGTPLPQAGGRGR